MGDMQQESFACCGFSAKSSGYFLPKSRIYVSYRTVAVSLKAP
jgi:hypothetical protein